MSTELSDKIELPPVNTCCIVTGTINEYLHVVEKLKTDKKLIRINDAKELRGLRRIPILFYGTYKEREDWPEIYLHIKAMDCPVKFLKGLQNEY